MIWLMFALIALAATAALLWPLLKKPAAAYDRAAYDLTVFQDQLKEVDREVARGVLNDAEAAAARLEIQRRILAASRTPFEPAPASPPPRRALAAIAVALAVPLLAGGIYLQVGTPDLAAAEANGGAAEIEKMVAQLAAKVAKTPNDIEAVALLARTYTRLGRFADAVTTYKQVLALEPDAFNFSSYGEAIVFGADGRVNKEAHDAFVKALSLDRSEFRSRFYLGLEHVDKQQPKDAIAVWKELTATAPADAPWREMVNEQMAGVAKEAKVETSTILPKHAIDFVAPEELALARVQASAPPMAVAIRPNAPSAPGQMSPEAAKKVEEMVAGLATRLEKSPDDYNGWLMLGRSYTVLKNYDGAKKAYDKASDLKPGDVEPKLQYMASLMTTVDPESMAALPLSVTEAAIAILKINPKQPEALYVSGLGRAKVGDKTGARTLLIQAKEAMPADSPLKADIDRRLEALK
ncbi:MAG: c-type cytochrome biogenesis protein CcmI [Rhodospirillaceae bacterium]|nr:c-type cytochrome biogenesis protein CcmI [Rhodospirillaceae bacterium]